MSILSGVKILEFEGIGPAPFCGMTLADLGAEVIVIERASSDHGPIADLGKRDILKRGKKSIALDLKNPAAKSIVFDLVRTADALIEGLRPGVMEKLGFGPNECSRVNKRLVYGRVTGWGQDGPLSQAAGHDINYVGLSGALWYGGKPGDPPFSPPTLLGDIGGGALYLTIGVLAAILNAKETGEGNVIDAAMIDGSAHMMNLVLNIVAAKQAVFERGKSILDGPHWFDTYKCKDGKFISVGSLESKFYRILLEQLGLSDAPQFQEQFSPAKWPEQKRAFEEIFITRTQQEWCDLLEGTDACFAPVLPPDEAALHPHMNAREIYKERNDALQAMPAPRFERGWNKAPGTSPRRGENTTEILSGLGRSDDEIDALKSDGAIA